MDKKILLVDDNPEIIESLRGILTGYSVKTATDGKSALSLAASEPPDVVLLDVNIPEVHGLDVLRKLAGMRNGPIVIMITGDDTKGTVSKALAVGVFSYLIKPLEKHEVLGQVEKAFAFRANQTGS
ncbi:MAG: response regulator [Elusimicrobiales bacterium]